MRRLRFLKSQLALTSGRRRGRRSLAAVRWSAVMGYDPVNEPVAPNSGVAWLPTEVRDAIDPVDQATLITYEGNKWSHEQNLLADDLFEDPQAMYHAHWYLQAEPEWDALAGGLTHLAVSMRAALKLEWIS